MKSVFVSNTKGDPVNYVDRTGLYDIGWGDYVETPDRAGGGSSVADYIQENRWYSKGFYIQSGVLLLLINPRLLKYYLKYFFDKSYDYYNNNKDACIPIDPCKDRIRPEDIIFRSERLPKKNENGKHQEYRVEGGQIAARVDFYILTGVFIEDLNMVSNGKACDGSDVNYHRAKNRITPKIPTIHIMHRPMGDDVKIRYRWF